MPNPMTPDDIRRYVADHTDELTTRLTRICETLPDDREDDGEGYIMLHDDLVSRLNLDPDDDVLGDAIDDALSTITSEDDDAV
jgi:hypothetical protein